MLANVYRTGMILGTTEKSIVELCYINNIPCALKRANPQLQSTDHIKKEIDMLLRCNDLGIPNIVQILDHNEEKTEFVTNLAECSLRDFLNRTRNLIGISEDQLAVLICGILQSLERMHKQGIANRDIKPENILVFVENEKCSFKMADFDLSHNYKPNSLEEIRGTPDYMSFNMIREWTQNSFPQKTKLNLEQEDLFSSGVLFGETATGTRPISYISNDQVTNAEEFHATLKHYCDLHEKFQNDQTAVSIIGVIDNFELNQSSVRTSKTLECYRLSRSMKEVFEQLTKHMLHFRDKNEVYMIGEAFQSVAADNGLCLVSPYDLRCGSYITTPGVSSLYFSEADPETEVYVFPCDRMEQIIKMPQSALATHLVRGTHVVVLDQKDENFDWTPNFSKLPLLQKLIGAGWKKFDEGNSARAAMKIVYTLAETAKCINVTKITLLNHLQSLLNEVAPKQRSPQWKTFCQLSVDLHSAQEYLDSKCLEIQANYKFDSDELVMKYDRAQALRQESEKLLEKLKEGLTYDRLSELKKLCVSHQNLDIAPHLRLILNANASTKLNIFKADFYSLTNKLINNIVKQLLHTATTDYDNFRLDVGDLQDAFHTAIRNILKAQEMCSKASS